MQRIGSFEGVSGGVESLQRISVLNSIGISVSFIRFLSAFDKNRRKVGNFEQFEAVVPDLVHGGSLK